MTTWKTLREELKLTEDDEKVIALEEDLIKTMVKIREEKGITQMQLAKMCDVKQPVIARIESSTHSPQVDSLLRILVPLGYTLQIVPIKRQNKTIKKIYVEMVKDIVDAKREWLEVELENGSMIPEPDELKEQHIYWIIRNKRELEQKQKEVLDQ